MYTERGVWMICKMQNEALRRASAAGRTVFRLEDSQGIPWEFNTNEKTARNLEDNGIVHTIRRAFLQILFSPSHLTHSTCTHCKRIIMCASADAVVMPYEDEREESIAEDRAARTIQTMWQHIYGLPNGQKLAQTRDANQPPEKQKPIGRKSYLGMGVIRDSAFVPRLCRFLRGTVSK